METKGSAGRLQAVTGSLETYVVWCSSPDSFSDPDNATGINIQITGDVRDASQKNFEILIQSISLRANPIILQEPVAVEELGDEGAETLTGEGFIWSFTTERDEAFKASGNPVALLIEELDGIVLPTGAIVHTSGIDQNIEFERKEGLC